jgi:preprotein translocase subunit YajC
MEGPTVKAVPLEQAGPKNDNFMILVIFMIFFLVLMGVILVYLVREQRKIRDKDKDKNNKAA